MLEEGEIVRRMPDPTTSSRLKAGVALAVVAFTLTALSLVQAGGVEANPTAEDEYSDGFETGDLSGYISEGMAITSDALAGSYSAEWTGPGTGYAYNPSVVLGCEEGEASITFALDGANSCVGVGFASEDGTWVYVVADPAKKEIRVERRVEGYSVFDTDVIPIEYRKISWHERVDEDGYYILEVEAKGVGEINLGEPYQLKLIFSGSSKCAIGVLEEISTGFTLARLRTIVDVVPEYLFFCSDGSARFDNLSFDSSVDDWVYDWEFYPEPVLVAGSEGSWDAMNTFNPAVFYNDNRFYMLYRGMPVSSWGTSKIGLATSDDGIHWEKYEGNPVLTAEDSPYEDVRGIEDPSILIDPFGDGKYWMGFMQYRNPRTSFWAVSEDLINWEVIDHPLFREGVRIQAIIDTEKEPYIDLVSYGGKEYRFIAYVEEEGGGCYCTLSNDLFSWTDFKLVDLTSPDVWASEYAPVAATFVRPDGRIEVFCCACTPEGYSGSPESGITVALMDGREPWRVLERAVLPHWSIYFGDVPDRGGADLSRWYDAPQFPGDVVRVGNKLYCYFGSNDQYVGLATCTLPTEFEVSDLTISELEVEPGEEVTVSVDVVNVGEAEGSYTVEFSIEGEVVDNQVVALEPGESVTVSFTLSRDEPGTYGVSVDGLEGSFDVAEAPPPPAEGVPVWLVVAVIVIIIVTAVIIYKCR